MLPGYELPRRTRRICTALKWLTILFGTIFTGFLILGDATGSIIDDAWTTLPKEIADAVVHSDGKRRLLTGLAAMFLLTDYLILIGMYRTFSALETGDAFAERSVKSIRFLGLMIVVYCIGSLASTSVMALALTFDSPPGSKLLTVSGSFGQLRTLLTGTILLIIGQIFTQAVRISDENRQIV